jgi:hypothetical protein
MPKSRGRRKKPKGDLNLPPRAIEIIKEQRQRFREKFGREMGPNDPVFFDPDADVPTPISTVRIEAETLEALRKAGAPPQIAYAYKKTGMLVMESSKDNIPKDRLKEWDAAIDEYFLIEEARKAGGPKPEGWNTEIPELLVSDLSQEDFDHVRACLKAMAPVEASRPMKLAARIELAAAALATACEHAFEGAHATGHPENAEDLYDKAEELVIRRARELYAQGPTE